MMKNRNYPCFYSGNQWKYSA